MEALTCQNPGVCVSESERSSDRQSTLGNDGLSGKGSIKQRSMSEKEEHRKHCHTACSGCCNTLRNASTCCYKS